MVKREGLTFDRIATRRVLAGLKGGKGVSRGSCILSWVLILALVYFPWTVSCQRSTLVAFLEKQRYLQTCTDPARRSCTPPYRCFTGSAGQERLSSRRELHPQGQVS